LDIVPGAHETAAAAPHEPAEPKQPTSPLPQIPAPPEEVTTGPLPTAPQHAIKSN